MRYEVIRPWQGVQAGDVLELETVHPSLVSHVRAIPKAQAAQLEPATPGATTPKRGRPPKAPAAPTEAA